MLKTSCGVFRDERRPTIPGKITRKLKEYPPTEIFLAIY